MMSSIYLVMHISCRTECAPELWAGPCAAFIVLAGNGQSGSWLLERGAARQRWRLPKMRSREQSTQEKSDSWLDSGCKQKA